MTTAKWIRAAGTAFLALMAVLFVARVAWVASHQAELRPVGDGDRAPDFDVLLIDGGRFRLDVADGRPGQVTLIDFWATWCGPCRQELPHIDALYRRLKDRGLRVIALDTEGEEAEDAVRSFAREHALALPIGLRGEQAAAAYKVTSLPHVVVVDASGRIRNVFMGTRTEAEIEAAVVAAMQP